MVAKPMSSSTSHLSSAKSFLMTPNDFVIQVATINGSGSQSANQVLVKTLFRMGIPVGGKNLFPSNIQGLPTWFTIRAHPEGFIARKAAQDIAITLNPASVVEDQAGLRPNGLFLYSSECRLQPADVRKDIVALAVPFKDLAGQATDSIKAKKLLANMVYVGILAELLPLDSEVLNEVVAEQFGRKAELLTANLKAVEVGREWAKGQTLPPVAKAKPIAGGNEDYILIDGNTAAGMGLVFAGCTFASWYPITPSSSLMEGFIKYSDRWRKDPAGKSKAAILQAEDELSAICMVLGAGWAGSRAATATSGPGLSLMSEAAGLAYFAEIPAVIWDVQRVGPSTGLPTRTMQGDVRAAAHLSHGDTKHVLLFPRDPAECFAFSQTAFDLAEQLQTLVIVLSDLDIGMNLHRTKAWSHPSQPFKRGKVLSADDLNKLTSFARYADPDGDGVGPRTLPGTEHPLAAYFTRGTGHDEFSRYTESAAVFKKTLDRLAKKWETAKTLVPKAEVETVSESHFGLIAYGSTDLAIPETRSQLLAHGLKTSYMRIKGYPFGAEVESFIQDQAKVCVIEQNHDGQLRQLLLEAFPHLAAKIQSVVNYDGWPLAAADVAAGIVNLEAAR